MPSLRIIRKRHRLAPRNWLKSGRRTTLSLDFMGRNRNTIIMRRYKFPAIIEQDEDGVYVGIALDTKENVGK